MSRTARRRYARFVKGRRRILADRAEHGSDQSCNCFAEEADRGRGPVFSRFADNPKSCAHVNCSNPRRTWGATWQEALYTVERELADCADEYQSGPGLTANLRQRCLSQ